MKNIIVGAGIMAACIMLPTIQAKGQDQKLERQERNFHGIVISKKLTLLDFWNINCKACFRSFPKLQELQEKFSEEIDIVLVSRETKVKVDEFYKKFPNLPRPKLRYVFGDSVLSDLFPDYALPYMIWLDSEGKLSAVTEAELDEKAITGFLSGAGNDMYAANKRKEYSSLIRAGIAAWNAPVFYYSYIAKCSDAISVGNTNVAPQEKGTMRISADCTSPAHLYETAYSERGKYNFNHPFSIVWNVSDPGYYTIPKDKKGRKEWDQQYRYSYELVVPTERSADMFKMMQQDLERYFGLKVTISKERYTLMQLLARPGPNLLATKGGRSFSSIQYDKRNGDTTIYISLRNQPFDSLTSIIRRNLPDMPIVLEDRSSYRNLGNIDVDMQWCLDKDQFIRSLRTACDKVNLTLDSYSTRADILTIADKE